MKNQPNKPQKRWRAIDFVTPLGAVRRAAGAISHTAGSFKDAAKNMAASLPGQQSAADYPEDDPRAITDSKERFEVLYSQNDWTEEALAQQVKVVRRTKLTAICVSIFALAGVVLTATSVPLWLALFLIPAVGSLLILGFAQAFKFALYEAQLALRDLISSREFVSRGDFWTRFFS